MTSLSDMQRHRLAAFPRVWAPPMCKVNTSEVHVVISTKNSRNVCMHSKVCIFAQVKSIYPQTPPSVMLRWYARELGEGEAYDSPVSVMYFFIVTLSPQPC